MAPGRKCLIWAMNPAKTAIPNVAHCSLGGLALNTL